ncbi:glutamate-cysteine ligase family protein [Streptoalloteichus hindustanus]|uniref:Glutamate--cysteine ligase EgtA n=1 Tax=Streptoalloteichus hindustanus TaxID=2017 RepID=A0A1M5LSX5_STRHI|nr:glutamate-cysteine ligase family protein [Streptoalloteichus hindustanus]SHG67729.1 glutamate--cysteine ligase [Streptoalloteichus hindustanus]
MTALRIADDADRAPRLLRSRAEAESHIASVAFAPGPPRLLGVELEWVVHHRADPGRPLAAPQLAAALGPYAPPTLAPEGPHRPLDHGSTVTVEPGGQVEISSAPHSSLAGLVAATFADVAQLVALLAGAGLVLGEHGIDAHRPPTRLLQIPRYEAMQRAFDRIGPDGNTMMCSTAGLQVCLDAGEPDRVAARWAAVHAVGPALSAAFANSPVLAGERTGWVSSRMASLFGTDPPRTRPAVINGDPAAGWARRVLQTPLVCVRRANGVWDAPPGVSFADWIAGAFAPAPTVEDLDYHMSTMFPPVRPRGYLEVRYLDTQPGDDWVPPVVALAALFARESTVDAVLELAAPTASHWVQAAREGLRDPALARVAHGLFDLVRDAVGDVDLPDGAAEPVLERLRAKLRPPGGAGAGPTGGARR